MTTNMDLAADDTKYCLLYWYFHERNWSIQSTLTITNPRQEIYRAGDLVVAKFQGRKYHAAIIRVGETRDMLKEDATLFEAFLRDQSLSPDEVMKKMGLDSDLAKKDDDKGLGNGSLPSLVVPEDGKAKPSPASTSASQSDKHDKDSLPHIQQAPRATSTSVQERSSVEGSTSSKTCHHCQNKCRCDSISSLKRRVERLEKALALGSTSSQAPQLAAPLSISPAADHTPTTTAILSPPVHLPQPASCLVAEPMSASSSSHTTPTDSSPLDVETLVAGLKHTAKDDVYGTVKRLATNVFTEQELCDCSVSGKRSAQSSETRPALNAAKFAMFEQAASKHLDLVTRKAIVEKLQNLQKHLRQRQKAKK